MIITNKIIANIIFGAVLVGGAAVSGVAAKQLVTSYPEIKDALNKDKVKITEVVSGESDSKPTSSKTSKSNINNTGCIIIVKGKKYDVEPLRKTHPGGDIFVCGTDMTERFNSQHGNDYARLAPYLVTGDGTSSSNSSSQNGSNDNENRGGDDDSNEVELEDEKEDENEIENEKEHENEIEFEFED